MRRRVAERLVAGVVLAVATAVFALAFTVGARQAPAAEPRPAEPAACESRLIRDWRDGRIDGTYPISCYRRAEKTLPTDLRVYSSAADDIRQALGRRVAEHGTRRPAG